MGVTSEPRARLHVLNSKIYDGRYAVKMVLASVGTSAVQVEHSTFDRNYVGIYTEPVGTNYPINILLNKNTFDCSAPLLPTHPNLPTSDNWAYAGIEVHNFVSLNVSNNQTFRNLTNGIVARSGFLTVSQSTFQTIQPRAFYNTTNLANGIGIYLDGSLGNYSLVQTGFGSTSNAPASFTDCHIGIRSISAKLEASKNRMLGITHRGIESQIAQVGENITISDNYVQLLNRTKAVGISLQQNVSTVRVQNNTLEAGLFSGNVTPGSPSAAAAIAINEDAVSHNLVVERNLIKLYRCAHGIQLNSISINAPNAGRISNNTVDFQYATQVQVAALPAPARRGISVAQCTNILVNCNELTSTTTPSGGGGLASGIFNNAIGIDMNDAHFTVQCNNMQRTATGLRVFGDCNNSVIQGNTFQKHQVGLLYEDNATTAPVQSHTGNLWLGSWPPNTNGARQVGTYANSAYFINIAANSQYLPPNISIQGIPASQWFQNQISSSTYTCAPNGCNPAMLLAQQGLNNLDVAIVNNQIPQNPIAMPWSLRKGLYNKLDKNPILRLNPAMAQFYNTHQYQAIGAVVAVADLRKVVPQIDSPTTLSVEYYFDTTRVAVDSTAWLDSLYLAGQITNGYWEIQRSSYLQQVQQQIANHQSLLDNAHNQIQGKSQNAQTLNWGIVPSNTPEENERVVNEIYLQTVAIGNLHFSAAQIQSLYDIATQCTELGGTAVYRARSIYALIDYQLFVDNCPPRPQARMDNVDTCHWDLELLNPSLEDTQFGEGAPFQWIVCASTPDIRPWAGDTYPSNGLFYSGLGAWYAPTYQQIESIGQALPLQSIKGVQYKFYVDLSKWLYLVDAGSVSFWLSDSSCVKKQMIYTAVVRDTLWQTHLVEVTPKNRTII